MSLDLLAWKQVSFPLRFYNILITLNLSISSLFFAKCFKGLGFLLSYEYELQIMEIREAVEEAADSQSLNKIQSQVLLGPLLSMFDGNINSEWLE